MKVPFKKTSRLMMLCLLLCQASLASGASDEMPIIAYWGVPDAHTSEENFRIISECGFTVSLFPYSSLDRLVQACRNADKYGVKILGQCPEMTLTPEKAAHTLKKENGFFGYFMQDEPSVPEIRQKQKDIQKLQNIDDTHCFYINLFPYSKPEWIEASTKAKTYPEYLQAASSTSCQQISFDFYPITTRGLHANWYHNLEMVRHESVVSGKPFWGFVLSVPHSVPFSSGNYYPTPTIASLRLQIYSNLAYGAQGIQYFTYWTPEKSSDKSNDFGFHDAPISPKGQKTRTYDVVQQMNKELKLIARLFYGARVTAVNHLGKVASGTTKLASAPLNISNLRISSRKGAVVSQFEKDGHQYLAIVNKDYQKSMEVQVKPKNSQPQHVTKSLQAEPIKPNYTLEPGDILLFRLL
ncbi:MAG: beta-galactosidase [Prevotella sp.]|nr:beta-galactosidase [Prevotella sp.]